MSDHASVSELDSEADLAERHAAMLEAANPRQMGLIERQDSANYQPRPPAMTERQDSAQNLQVSRMLCARSHACLAIMSGGYSMRLPLSAAHAGFQALSSLARRQWRRSEQSSLSSQDLPMRQCRCTDRTQPMIWRACQRLSAACHSHLGRAGPASLVRIPLLECMDAQPEQNHLLASALYFAVLSGCEMWL
jgi:hypothetical protein